MRRTRSDDRTPTHGPQSPPRSGSPRRWRGWVTLAVCLALVGLLSSCGQERQGDGAAPLSERSENDVPLNPPTLRFHVSADGHVDASPDREAEAGEVVAIVLENESESTYELRLLDPEGDQVYAVEAPAGERGGGRAMPRDPGAHVVEVYRRGARAAAEEFPVDVSET